MENSQRERTCPPSAGYYTWQQGDTLVGVAQRYGLTTSAIRQANAGLPLETVAPVPAYAYRPDRLAVLRAGYTRCGGEIPWWVSPAGMALQWPS